MSDLSPSWDEETIALLIGKSLHSTSTSCSLSSSNNIISIPSDSVVVEMIGIKGANEEGCDNETRSSKSKASKTNTTRAKVIFASFEEQRRVINAYEGLAVPMTHGYHYYRFSDASLVSSGEDQTCSKLLTPKISAVETPPLHLQLIAVPTKELDRRTQIMISKTPNSKDSKIMKDKKQNGNNKRCRVHKHALQCYHLCHHFNNSRPERLVFGVPVPPGSIDDLLDYLRTSSSSLWPPAERQRKGVSAGNYLTVRKQHPPEHDKIWNLCHDLIISTLGTGNHYSALAITKAFVGSPHIDNHDKTFQHVIALGNFEGGMLCTEADSEGAETLAIDVRNRFGRIDGRGVHWVSGWEGERYSVVYYSTSKEDETDRVPQSAHTEWMESMQRGSLK